MIHSLPPEPSKTSLLFCFRSDRDGNIVAESDDLPPPSPPAPAAAAATTAALGGTASTDGPPPPSPATAGGVGVVDGGASGDGGGSFGVARERAGSSPSEDAQWVREELHRWIHGNVRVKWPAVYRKVGEEVSESVNEAVSVMHAIGVTYTNQLKAS